MAFIKKVGLYNELKGKADKAKTKQGKTNYDPHKYTREL